VPHVELNAVGFIYFFNFFFLFKWLNMVSEVESDLCRFGC
jgi:hypothetical protein